jgi:hypothetical protein
VNYIAQPPPASRPVQSTIETRYHPAYVWWRVTDAVGSTIAFVPDEPTARRIAALLTEHSEGRAR